MISTNCCCGAGCCVSATPTAPFGITLLSCDGSSMTIAWKSPKHCGGSKIKAYYIDRRDADSLVWKEVNQAAVTERICTVRIPPTHTHTHRKRTIDRLYGCRLMV